MRNKVDLRYCLV